MKDRHQGALSTFARVFSGALLTLLVAPIPAQAHFVWLSSNGDGQVEFYFGESPTERNYHLPTSLEKAEIWHFAPNADPRLVARSIVEEESFNGLRGDEKGAKFGLYDSQVVYGSFRGSKLTYHARHLADGDPKAWPKKTAGKLDLQLLAIPDNESLRVQVLWKKQSLGETKVTLYGPDGKAIESQTTDASGNVTFKDALKRKGLHGLLASKSDKEETGELKGEKYKGSTHYGSLTFVLTD